MIPIVKLNGIVRIEDHWVAHVFHAIKKLKKKLVGFITSKSTGGFAIISEIPPITVSGIKIVRPSLNAARCLCEAIFVATGTTFSSITFWNLSKKAFNFSINNVLSILCKCLQIWLYSCCEIVSIYFDDKWEFSH